MTVGPFGTFGATPEDVFATDFYSFFHFGEVTRNPSEGGGAIRSYRTSGSFHGLVVFDVATDADGQTDWLSLRVARSFVDHPRDGVFARDVVGSFIREGTVGQGFDDSLGLMLQDLRSQSLHRRDEVSYTDSNPLPPMPYLPGDFRAVLAVCRGAEASFLARLAHTDLRMSNDHFDGAGALTVSLHLLDGRSPCVRLPSNQVDQGPIPRRGPPSLK